MNSGADFVKQIRQPAAMSIPPSLINPVQPNQRGELKVSDFSIARSLRDSVSRLTLEQGRSGTLVYMSPQQLNGERSIHLDDIYSLGATIYELLTSRPPFYTGNIDRQICKRITPSMTERRKEFNIEPA